MLLSAAQVMTPSVTSFESQMDLRYIYQRLTGAKIHRKFVTTESLSSSTPSLSAFYVTFPVTCFFPYLSVPSIQNLPAPLSLFCYPHLLVSLPLFPLHLPQYLMAN